MYQVLRYMLEVRDADGQYNSSGLNCLAILEPQNESAGQAIHTDHELVFEFRHHAVPEGDPVCAERLKAHRHSRIGILDAPFRTNLTQSECLLGVVDIRRETIRLQHHAL